MGRNKRIPERWLDYQPIKDIIYDARIIPIKCPLPYQHFQSYVLSQHRWTPADVIHRVSNLGLVIDITNKIPGYYNSNEFLENAIDYIKIPCVGHHVPDDNVYRKFCEAVNNFLEKNKANDDVIAVHCTHGVNRTGYIICRYLIERLQYSSQDALHKFAQCRGYPVERENYIEDLHRLFRNKT
ncbi:RNA/RNP complex-1-interacting phosphatase-like [Argiope bruennichi]|uniref:RNA/RNP complex-1-interacting phosphatase-like n=1 Tax=Argiope bruennichi TaxID=94029 RepID=UPI002495A05B|nr:RNA/RNP complex-1-interacting phosphatase-like [Argiope bruennichi]